MKRSGDEDGRLSPRPLHAHLQAANGQVDLAGDGDRQIPRVEVLDGADPVGGFVLGFQEGVGADADPVDL